MSVALDSPDESVSIAAITVERGIAELRAGRAVILTHAGQHAIACSIEALDDCTTAWLGTRASNCRLVLSSPRLRRLGIARPDPGVISVSPTEFERIQYLATEVDAQLDAPVSAAGAPERAALELMNLALILPAAVVASVTATDLPHLLRVAVEDIAPYRQSRTRLQLVGRAPVPLEEAGTCEFVIFRGGEGLRDHVAVIVGAPDLTKPVAVRLHSACLTGDLFGSLKCDCGDQLRHTVQWMAANEGGILLYLDQEGRGNGIANKIRAYKLQSEGYDTYGADEILGFELDQRHFDFAAEMLRQIGVSRVRILTNNPQKITAMRAAGLDVVSEQRVNGRPTAENQGYLQSKRDRAGHFIDVKSVAARAPD